VLLAGHTISIIQANAIIKKEIQSQLSIIFDKVTPKTTEG